LLVLSVTLYVFVEKQNPSGVRSDTPTSPASSPPVVGDEV